MPRGVYRRTEPAQIDDKADALIVTIKLLSGRFESTIQVPLLSSKEERDKFVDSWFTLMEAGIKCGSFRKEQSNG